MNPEKNTSNGGWQKLSVIISILSVVLAPVFSVYASISVMDEKINALKNSVSEVRDAVIENQRDVKCHLQFHLEKENGR